MEKRYMAFHLGRLRCLMSAIIYGGAFTYEDAMAYGSSLTYALPFVPVPGEDSIDESRAYANLHYHATHPGAIFANDAYTRAGVEMAVRALERASIGQKTRSGRREK